MSIPRTPLSQPARDPSVPLKDPCECCGLVEADTELSEASIERFAGYKGLLGARFSNECWKKHYDSAVLAARIRARRAAPRMYGTMPEVLPETLPAGTVIRLSTHWLTLLAPASILDGRMVYDCPARMIKDLSKGTESQAERTIGAAIPAYWIDWSLIPIQEAKPRCGSAFTLIGSVVACALDVGHVGWHSDCIGENPTMFAHENELGNGPLACYAPLTPRATQDPYHSYAMLHNVCEATIGELTRSEPANVAARARMLAADAREKPRVSAEARELALPHPWDEF